MSFSQEMKDFTGAFKVGSDVVNKSKLASARADMMNAQTAAYKGANASASSQTDGAQAAFNQGKANWGTGSTSSSGTVGNDTTPATTGSVAVPEATKPEKIETPKVPFEKQDMTGDTIPPPAKIESTSLPEPAAPKNQERAYAQGGMVEEEKPIAIPEAAGDFQNLAGAPRMPSPRPPTARASGGRNTGLPIPDQAGDPNDSQMSFVPENGGAAYQKPGVDAASLPEITRPGNAGGQKFDRPEMVLGSALHGAITYLQKTFGLGEDSDSPTDATGATAGTAMPSGPRDPNRGVRMLSSHAGAMSPEEFSQIRKIVDPKGQLDDQLGNVAGLNAMYEYYLSKGDVAKANQAAASMVQTLSLVSSRLGAQAEAAVKSGNFPQAAELLKKAYEFVPDGNSIDAKMSKDGSGQVTVRGPDGQVIQSGPFTPQQLLDVATGMRNGSMFWRQLTGAAGKYMGVDPGTLPGGTPNNPGRQQRTMSEAAQRRLAEITGQNPDGTPAEESAPAAAPAAVPGAPAATPEAPVEGAPTAAPAPTQVAAPATVPAGQRTYTPEEALRLADQGQTIPASQVVQEGEGDVTGAVPPQPASPTAPSAPAAPTEGGQTVIGKTPKAIPDEPQVQTSNTDGKVDKGKDPNDNPYVVPNNEIPLDGNERQAAPRPPAQPQFITANFEGITDPAEQRMVQQATNAVNQRRRQVYAAQAKEYEQQMRDYRTGRKEMVWKPRYSTDGTSAEALKESASTHSQSLTDPTTGKPFSSPEEAATFLGNDAMGVRQIAAGLMAGNQHITDPEQAAVLALNLVIDDQDPKTPNFRAKGYTVGKQGVIIEAVNGEQFVLPVPAYRSLLQTHKSLTDKYLKGKEKADKASEERTRSIERVKSGAGRIVQGAIGEGKEAIEAIKTMPERILGPEYVPYNVSPLEGGSGMTPEMEKGLFEEALRRREKAREEKFGKPAMTIREGSVADNVIKAISGWVGN